MHWTNFIGNHLCLYYETTYENFPTEKTTLPDTIFTMNYWLLLQLCFIDWNQNSNSFLARVWLGQNTWRISTFLLLSFTHCFYYCLLFCCFPNCSKKRLVAIVGLKQRLCKIKIIQHKSTTTFNKYVGNFLAHYPTYTLTHIINLRPIVRSILFIFHPSYPLDSLQHAKWTRTTDLKLLKKVNKKLRTIGLNKSNQSDYVLDFKIRYPFFGCRACKWRWH